MKNMLIKKELIIFNVVFFKKKKFLPYNAFLIALFFNFGLRYI